MLNSMTGFARQVVESSLGTLTCEICNSAGCRDCDYPVNLVCRCVSDMCSGGVCTAGVNRSSSECIATRNNNDFGCSSIVSSNCR